MSFRSTNPATAITAAIGWFGLAIFAFLAVWHLPKAELSWWVKIAAGLAGSLAFIGYGVEALSQELTVRRWAISQFIFTTVTVVLIVAAILNDSILGLGRGLMLAFAAVYLVGALFCMSEAKDLF
jgi:hypothetical protein